MKNLVKTDFDTTVEELNSLNEQYADTADFNVHINLKTPSTQEIKKAQDDFKNNANNLILDYPNFHLGYDLMMFEALFNFYLNDQTNANNSAWADDHARQIMNAMFDDNGRWKGRGSYNYIKNIIVPLGNKELERAMKLAWGLMYTSDSAKIAHKVIKMNGSTITTTSNVANNVTKDRAIAFVKEKLSKGIFMWTGGFNENSSFENATFEEKFLTFLCMQLSIEQEIKTIPMAIRGVAVTDEQRTLFIRGMQTIRDIIYSKNYDRVLDIYTTIAEVHGELEKGGAYYTDWFQVFYNNKKIFVDFEVMEMGLALFMKKIGWHLTYDKIVDIIGIDNLEKHFKYGDSFLCMLNRIKVIED